MADRLLDRELRREREVGRGRLWQAVAGELITYIDRDAEVFRSAREALVGAGDALVQRAQEAGVLRPDTSFGEIGRLVGTIGGLSPSDPDELERMLGIVLDGLRYRPPA